MGVDQGCDRQAWIRAVLRDHEGPLLLYALRVTHNLESARDVVQETFLRLCGDAAAQSNGHLRPWLYTVCRNAALDLLRKRRRHDDIATDPSQQAVAEPAAHGAAGNDPVELLEGQERTSQMLGFLAGLPTSQQEVLRLRFQHGLSYKEIAAVTGRTVNHVGFLIHTAVKSLRTRMETGGRET